MSRSFHLAANWKMHFVASEARSLYESVVAMVEATEQRESANKVSVSVAAPAVHLAALSAVRSPMVEYGSQNIHHEKSGAFTGEISVPMVQDYGATFALVGHSERRIMFGETEVLLAQRAEGALQQGLRIIYCVGETLEQREQGETSQVLNTQMSTIGHLCDKFFDLITIAYEPVWAIGTGKVASPEEIQRAHQEVKALGRAFAPSKSDLPVLYGGSVKPDNIQSLLEISEVDGALVGGASLSFDSFRALYEGSCQ